MLDEVFNFIIGFFNRTIGWVFNLQLHITDSFSISLGVFVISCFIIGLAIRFIFNSFGFNK